MKNKSIILVCPKDPLKIIDGVTAALNSLVNLLLIMYDNIDICIINNDIRVRVFNTLNPNEKNDIELNDLDLGGYDYIFSGPLLTTNKILQIIPYNFKGKLISQLSDCYTYALYRNFILGLKFGNLDFKSILKIPYYYYIEYKTQKNSDIILLQTNRDKQIFSKLFFSKKSIAIPNLPQIKTNNSKFIHKSGIGWCASFTGSYLNLSIWFLHKILIPFLKENTDCRIHLLGSNSKVFLNKIKKTYPKYHINFILEPYHNDITIFFQARTFVLSPIYKGYGLINKTVEAMSAKTIVVGDKTAFNGIEGCISGENCMIAKNKNNFVELMNLISNKLSQSEKNIIENNASTLINMNFKQKVYVSNLKEYIRLIN